MGNIIVIVAMIVCVLLVLIVLVQNPKGGGLSSAFGGAGTQSFGVQRTTNFLEKATWGLAIFLFVLCISGGLMLQSGSNQNDQGPTNVEDRLLDNPNANPIVPQPFNPGDIQPIEIPPSN